MKRSTTTGSGTKGRPSRTVLPVVAVGAIAFGWLMVAAAHDVANGTLAAAIRASGHPCARVIKKERLSGSESVWRVHCNSGHFQVTMKGDSASEVVALD